MYFNKIKKRTNARQMQNTKGAGTNVVEVTQVTIVTRIKKCVYREFVGTYKDSIV